MNRLLLLTFFSLLTAFSFAQNEAVVFGTVSDLDTKEPIEFVTVYAEGNTDAVETNEYGQYRLLVEPHMEHTIVFSRVGYHEAKTNLLAMRNGVKRNINIKMASQMSDVEIVIRESRIEDVGMVKEEVTELKKLPTSSGNFESILPHIALGTYGGSGGELSSQYNVRGGNYDENLVYVNDFEIFRPQLIRSSQQEGLSFPNIDLIRDLSFSSGGFQPKYGDKLSSVLDIRYKRPDETRLSLSMSLLGAGAHIEGSKRIGPNAYNKLRYLIGARYKTQKYLLGTLDTKGEYLPSAGDIQSWVTYDFTKDLQIGWLGNFNQNQFDFIPADRSTATGFVDFTYQLTTVFQGQERDYFKNGMNGLALTFLPEKDKNPLYLKLMGSYYLSEESENFDILGFYRLSQIETNLGSENAGQEIQLLGVGTQHLYARNSLLTQIYNAEHRGGIELQSDNINADISNFVQWSVKYQNEEMDDVLNEWERLDSAGYSIPFLEDELLLNEVLKTENVIRSSRMSGFLQNSYTLFKPERFELKLTAGARATYWDLNGELNISPRGELLYKPANKENEISFKLASGVYYQPPFYREMRRPDGSINTDLKSQRSIHFVAGMTYDFLWKTVSDKKFKLISEVYYKKLDNLVSFEVENVRIRYSGENDSDGYVMGADLRINGEFVPGAESWINISWLQAKERLEGIDHLAVAFGDTVVTSVNYVPRPTEQTFNLALFFQDYLPKNENFKMHLNLQFGSGLPFGVKGDNVVFRNPFRYKFYQRVDAGFAIQLWDQNMALHKPHNPFRFTRSTWLSLEIFNMLSIRNVASNTWVKSIGEQQLAVPNFLTGLRLNLRLKVEF